MFEGSHEKVWLVTLERQKQSTHNLMVQALEAQGGPEPPPPAGHIPVVSKRLGDILQELQGHPGHSPWGQQRTPGSAAWGLSRKGPLCSSGACLATQVPWQE